MRFNRICRALLSASIVVIVQTACATRTPDGPPIYLVSATPTVLFSVNDGEAGALFSDSDIVVEDSVTVIHLTPDAPPRVVTRYGEVSSTILGSPHAAIVGGFGIVTNSNIRFNDQAQLTESKEPWGGENEVKSIDLDSLQVAGTLVLESAPWLSIAHPDGRRVVVALSDGWIVLEIGDDGALSELSRSRINSSVFSFDIGPDGKTIIAVVAKESAAWEIKRYSLNSDNSITHTANILSDRFRIDGPFSPRILSLIHI